MRFTLLSPTLILLITQITAALAGVTETNIIEVWRAKAAGGDYKFVGEVPANENTFDDKKDLVGGQEYFYRLRAVDVYKVQMQASGSLMAFELEATIPKISIRGEKELIRITVRNPSSNRSAYAGTTVSLMREKLFADETVETFTMGYLAKGQQVTKEFQSDLSAHGSGDYYLKVNYTSNTLDTKKQTFDLKARSKYTTNPPRNLAASNAQHDDRIRLAWDYSGSGTSWLSEIAKGQALAKPKIVTALRPVAVGPGQRAELSFYATGKKLVWYWYKGNTVVQRSGWRYIIEEARDRDEGQYTVKIFNAAGHVSTSAPLTVGVDNDGGNGAISLPAPNINAPDPVNARNFRISWTHVPDAQGYRLYVARNKDLTQAVPGYYGKDMGKQRASNIPGLDPQTTYYVSVRSEKGSTNSTFAPARAVTTLPDSPVADAVTFSGSDSFKAQWQAVSGATHYLLDIAIDPNFESILARYRGKNVGNVTSHNIRDLDPAHTYYFRVRTVTGTGTSHPSNTVSHTFRSANTASAPFVGSITLPHHNGVTDKRTLQVYFNWSEGTPTQYRISENASMQGASWKTFTDAPEFTLSAREGTKTVYFQLRNANGTSQIVKDTVVYKASTNTGSRKPGKPILIRNHHGGDADTTTPLLEWANDGAEATSYKVYIARNGKKYRLLNTNNNYWKSRSSMPEGNYAWVVFGINNYGEGPGSEPGSFKIASDKPKAAELKSYADGSDTTDRTPTLSWESPHSLASSYQLALKPSGKHMQFIKGITDEQWTPGKALNLGRYDWYVRGWNTDGWGDWSGKGSFRIIPQPPGKVGLTSYTDGSDTTDLTPTLKWDTPTNGAFTYQLYIKRNGKVWFNDRTRANAWTPAKALETGTYQWFVRGWNRDGWGSWSNPGSFVIPSLAPGKVNLTSYTDGSTSSDTTPTLSWGTPTNGAHTYQLYIKRNGKVWFNDRTRSRAWTPGRSIPTGTYQWFVRGWNTHGWGPWSSPGSFVVRAQTVPTPGKPTLTAMHNGATTTDTTPTLKWAAGNPPGTSYNIYLEKSDGTGTGATVSGTQWTPSASLSPDTYTWQVVAENSHGYGPWSAKGTFTISTGGGGGGGQKRFAVTRNRYAWNSDWEAAVRAEFGAGAKVADWKDVVAVYGGNRQALLSELQSLGQVNYGDSASVKVNGKQYHTYSRAYYISVHFGNPPSSFFDHDDLHDHLVSLGSWSGNRYILVDVGGGSSTGGGVVGGSSFTLDLPNGASLGASLEMLWVSPGTFTMGSPSSENGRRDNERQHRVTLTKGYWLGKYEVTQAQWKAVMGGNRSYFSGSSNPVEGVDWDDAMEFCRMVTERERRAGRLPAGYEYSLPTEAQWEYACRAGTTSALNNGKELTSTRGRCLNLDEVAWYYQNSGERPHPVGQKRANAWGFYDMHGNVWEHCYDLYDSDYPSGSVTDPTGAAWGSYRVLRGGGWTNYGEGSRSASRAYIQPSLKTGAIGFRLALRPVQ